MAACATMTAMAGIFHTGDIFQLNHMKKLIFTIVLTLIAALNFNANAQANFFYAKTNGSSWTYISSTNIGITTYQKSTIGGPDNTVTISAPGGAYTNPTGNFAYGSYWTAPTIFLPFKVSIAAGYTATVANPNSSAHKVYLQLALYDNNTPGVFATYQSSTYNVPANGSVTIPIPACAADYTTLKPDATYAGDAYPTLVYLRVQDTN